MIPASLCLLFLPHLPAISTGTTGPARILRIRLDCLHANPAATSVNRSAEACPHRTTVRSRRFTPANVWRQHCSFLIGTFHRRYGLVYVSFIGLRIASHIEQR